MVRLVLVGVVGDVLAHADDVGPRRVTPCRIFTVVVRRVNSPRPESR